jgi:AcrR family transcriptional regulator
VRYRREDVVERAIAVLDQYGLADLTMRRLGSELGVRPSALYHHFVNKQTLLAAVADELLARRARRTVPGHGDRDWRERAEEICGSLRDALLSYRDGAELVATVHAFGLGGRAPYAELVDALADSGLPAAEARTAARTLLHFVFGHTGEEQTHLQAASAGAIDDEPRETSDFDLGLALVLDGIRLRVEASGVRPR